MANGACNSACCLVLSLGLLAAPVHGYQEVRLPERGATSTVVCPGCGTATTTATLNGAQGLLTGANGIHSATVVDSSAHSASSAASGDETPAQKVDEADVDRALDDVLQQHLQVLPLARKWQGEH
ncbi:hypothetical protein [Dyella choica]|uniref:Uncharacterized protein n=1 Tax=Dyella choica TaxID=1927959 RepID=A0A432M2E9_9GAMM|nr:hypothetical protein [Dyella choica]RUL72438.1 hypothetical protein EKH80_17270 [Dyella choica]